MYKILSLNISMYGSGSLAILQLLTLKEKYRIKTFQQQSE